MGIFSEDLINLGNLIDVEFDINLSEEAINRAFEGLSFEIEDGFMRVGYRKKSFLFSKKVEILLREDPLRVKNTPQERGIGLLVATEKNLREILEKNDFELEQDRLYINLFDAIKDTEEYKKVPKQFKDRIVINRYKLRKGYIQLWVKVSKGL
ncbi:hypothetical protein [Thermocrinis sp.]